MARSSISLLRVYLRPYYTRLLTSVSRINEFFQIQPGVQEAASQTLPAAAPSVRFKDVTFACKDRLPVNGDRSSVNGKPITVYRLPFTVYR